MSRLFTRFADGWDVQSLEDERHLVRTPECGAESVVCSGEQGAPAMLVRIGSGADGANAGWAVIADGRTRLFVNGEPIETGIALLRDRDELRVDGAEAAYFSAERFAVVEVCDRDDAPRCPRCAQAIARGEMAVRCPGCGVLHHQMTERECWTYLETCALCAQATDLAAGLRWSPEEL